MRLLAVESFHSKGILHRDLKPENIMIDYLKNGSKILKIIDFGIAKDSKDKGITTETQTTSAMRTT